MEVDTSLRESNQLISSRSLSSFDADVHYGNAHNGRLLSIAMKHTLILCIIVVSLQVPHLPLLQLFHVQASAHADTHLADMLSSTVRMSHSFLLHVLGASSVTGHGIAYNTFTANVKG
jgi:hypothetical protein